MRSSELSNHGDQWTPQFIRIGTRIITTYVANLGSTRSGLAFASTRWTLNADVYSDGIAFGMIVCQITVADLIHWTSLLALSLGWRLSGLALNHRSSLFTSTSSSKSVSQHWYPVLNISRGIFPALRPVYKMPVLWHDKRWCHLSFTSRNVAFCDNPDVSRILT